MLLQLYKLYIGLVYSFTEKKYTEKKRCRCYMVLKDKYILNLANSSRIVIVITLFRFIWHQTEVYLVLNK